MAVVGAGIIGLSVARALHERGAAVTVLERTGIGSGASGVQPGGVRQQWGTSVNCRLARESLAFYRRADELLDPSAPLGFRACGYLFLAHSHAALARLAANADVQRAEGVPSQLVTPAEAEGLVPGLRTTTIVGGGWCAEDGYFDRPQGVVEAFARGTDVVVDEVVRIVRERAGWSAVLASGTHVSVRTLVVAAGADTVDLLAPLAIEVPIERERRYLFLSEPIRERLVEPLVVSPERRFAAKQLGGGRVLASDLGAAGDPDLQSSAWRANVRAAILELLPVLEFVDFTVLVGGDYDVTPDRQPVLGEVPGQPGLWVAAGFSGHGFMLAPAIGRLLGEAIAGTARDEALRILDPARFAEGRLVPEPAIV